MNAHRPTVSGVAERAGVTVASVLRALNGLAASDEVRHRVTEAATALGLSVQRDGPFTQGPGNLSTALPAAMWPAPTRYEG
ncbi:MAG: LacI family DNA-binding transcriptional regulator [Nocardioides sp.]|nr:LacI family DNA-binding transcriptional regulator [Nocardioides sp.]